MKRTDCLQLVRVLSSNPDIYRSVISTQLCTNFPSHCYWFKQLWHKIQTSNSFSLYIKSCVINRYLFFTAKIRSKVDVVYFTYYFYWFILYFLDRNSGYCGSTGKTFDIVCNASFMIILTELCSILLHSLLNSNVFYYLFTVPFFKSPRHYSHVLICHVVNVCLSISGESCTCLMSDFLDDLSVGKYIKYDDWFKKYFHFHSWLNVKCNYCFQNKT